MMDGTDRMSFVERTKNFLAPTFIGFFTKWKIIDRQTAIFRTRFGSTFPDLTTLASKCPLVMVNSDELLDFPRPILHKIVYIGGIGMKKTKKLDSV